MKLLAICTLVAATGFFSSAMSFGKDVDSMKALLPSYVSIQEALANDDFTTAQKNAGALTKLVSTFKGPEQKEIKTSLDSFVGTKDIKAARESFKALSKPFVSWIDKNKGTEYEVVFCSMAEAKWVQKKGEVSNPYYGAEMRTCGEK